MSYLKDREVWLPKTPTGNPPAGYFWKFIQDGVVVVRDSDGVDYVPVNKSGDTMTGLLRATAGINFEESGGDTLNDYETEGTFTLSDTSGGGLTLTQEDKEYTLIGNIAFVTVKITFPSTSDTRFNEIGGFPFVFDSMPKVVFYCRILGTGFGLATTRPSNAIRLRSSTDDSALRNNDLSGKTIELSYVQIL